MIKFVKLNKLKKGDKVAIVSPSFGGPGKWPHVYELGLKRIREVFDLEPVEFPATRKLGASKEERASDLIAAFESREIKAVIASIGGDDQVTYIKNLPAKPFTDNPKLFFGVSDNTHFSNFLWLNGIPSYYGGMVLTQYAMQTRMDEFTVLYLKRALFEEGEFELLPSAQFNDVGLQWNDPETLKQSRVYEPNDGYFWDGAGDAEGITWGGCLESIDEILRNGVEIPTLDNFKHVVLMTETSEEIPKSHDVFRVYRALGERGILERVKGVLVGRPKGWHFNNQMSPEQKASYRAEQRETILKVVREYNPDIPVVQNMDFGHTDPQIPVPYGRKLRIDSGNKKIFAEF